MFDDKDYSGTTCTTNEASKVEPANLPELEVTIEKISRQFSRTMLQEWLENCEDIHPNPTTKCRWCGEDANYISKRVGTADTKFGLVRYRRAYYLCPHCYQSTCPLDERLNPYESLARLRILIANGINLRVNELAKAWGLGSLKQATSESLEIQMNSQDDLPLSSHVIERNPYSHNHIYDYPFLS